MREFIVTTLMSILTIDGKMRLSSTVSNAVLGIGEGVVTNNASGESSFTGSAGLMKMISVQN